MAKNGNGKRFQQQSLALFLVLAAPFGLYWGLETGLTALAAACFAVIVAGMLLTLKAG